MVENLGQTINSSHLEASPWISPDEQFLIIESWKPGGSGRGDLYICYRKSDGSWTSPQNLGPLINTEQIDDGACVSPDGKYFFFNRRKDWVTKEQTDIHWVDVRSIFKPYVLNPIGKAKAAVGEDFKVRLPPDEFADYDDDALVYAASSADGKPLPAWLTFDPKTRTLAGMPNDAGTLVIEITATDSMGSACSDELTIRVDQCARLMSEAEGRWVSIVDGRPYPRDENGTIEPAETIEACLAALPEDSPRGPHRFVFRLGEEGDRTATLASLFPGPNLVGNEFKAERGIITRYYPTRSSITWHLGVDGPSKTFVSESFPSITVRLSSPNGLHENVVELGDVTAFSGHILLDERVAADLALSLFEVPGSLAIDMLDSQLKSRRAIVRLVVSELDLDVLVPVAIWSRSELSDLDDK